MNEACEIEKAFCEEDAEQIFVRGVELANIRQYKEAIRWFWKVVELDPNHRLIWVALGGVLAKMGDSQKAAEAYMIALRLYNPDYFSIELEDPRFADSPRLLYICPECGAFLSEKTEKCILCGAEYDSYGDVSDECGSDIVEPLDDSGDVELRELLHLCPSCGAFVSKNATTCTICETELIVKMTY